MKYNIQFKFLTLFSCLLLFSCGKSDSKEDSIIVSTDDVKQINVLTEETRYNDHVLFPKDAKIISDTLLAVFEPKDQEGFLCIYNDKTKTPLNKLGVSGAGPEEFINPRVLFDLSEGNDFIVGDIKELKKFKADSILNHRYSGDFVCDLPNEFKLYNYLVIDNDTMMVCSQAGEHQLSIYKKHTKSMEYRDFTPDYLSIEVPDLANVMNVYEACFTGKNNKIAVAYHNWKQIDIYDINTSELKRVKIDDYMFNKNLLNYDSNKKIVEIARNAKIFFTNVKSTKNYIFAICWDAAKEQIKKAKVSSKLYQLDWSGNVVAVYSFNKPISNFCLDGDKLKYAIGISDDGEMHIFYCKY